MRFVKCVRAVTTCALGAATLLGSPAAGAEEWITRSYILPDGDFELTGSPARPRMVEMNLSENSAFQPVQIAPHFYWGATNSLTLGITHQRGICLNDGCWAPDGDQHVYNDAGFAILASLVRKRRFELVTFAAAHALRSTLCSLAHGKALTGWFSEQDVLAMARGEVPESLSAAEAAMLDYARKVARDATTVTAEDVGTLKRHQFSDAEIFDIAATAAARAFWTKLVEGLGVEAEPSLRAMQDDFRNALVVGRPLDRAAWGSMNAN